MKKNRAFTLIELAVVVVVIGALIAGVIKGSSLINATRLATARSLTAHSVVPSISGLVAWYETSLQGSLFDSETIKNSPISEWRDANPTAIAERKNTLSRSADEDVVFMPQGINNLPSLSFKNDAQISLSSFDQGEIARSTVFFVFYPLSPSDATLLDSANSTPINISSNSVSINAGNTLATSPGSAFSATGYIIAAYFNGASSAIYLNNDSARANGDAGNNVMQGLSVGGSGFNGFVSEVIIYNRPLKAFEFNDVMTYLSKKYKIPVAVRL